MAVDDVDAGRKEGLTSAERKELVQLRRQNRVQAMEIEILKRASAYFARKNVLQKADAAGPQAGRRRRSCRSDLQGVLGISRSGFYEARNRPPSPRAVSDQGLTELIREVQLMSRRSYGGRGSTPSSALAWACRSGASASPG